MADFNVRSDAVNVEQIMEQIRGRIREKRGVDYTEQEIRELASVKLEKFLDPRGVRSDLLEQFRRAQPPYSPPELPNYVFEDQTLFESTRGPLRLIRRMLLPILKLFFNPNPLIQALNIQSRLNASAAEREAKRDATRHAFDQLHYEVMHNLVIETTRLGIEVKNLKMRLESLASRLEFNERRARALESVVAYKPAPEDRPQREPRRNDEPRRGDESRRNDDSRRNEESRREEPRREEPRRGDVPPRQPAPVATSAAVATSAETTGAVPEASSVTTGPEGPGQKSRRRRRRRGRRGAGSATAAMGASGQDVEAQSIDSEDAETGMLDDAPEPATDFDTDVREEGPDAVQPDHDSEAHPSDSRTARPEPFEHTFGAQAHPAEPATSDPTQQSTAPSVTERGGGASPDPGPSADGPARTPEQ